MPRRAFLDRSCPASARPGLTATRLRKPSPRSPFRIQVFGQARWTSAARPGKGAAGAGGCGWLGFVRGTKGELFETPSAARGNPPHPPADRRASDRLEAMRPVRTRALQSFAAVGEERLDVVADQLEEHLVRARAAGVSRRESAAPRSSFSVASTAPRPLRHRSRLHGSARTAGRRWRRRTPRGVGAGAAGHGIVSCVSSVSSVSSPPTAAESAGGGAVGERIARRFSLDFHFDLDHPGPQKDFSPARCCSEAPTRALSSFSAVSIASCSLFPSIAWESSPAALCARLPEFLPARKPRATARLLLMIIC